MSREAEKRVTIPSYSPHTPRRQRPASPAALHTVCSGSPRPRPHSSSCSPDGPPGAWKQRQSDDLKEPGSPGLSHGVRPMGLTFSESWPLEYLMMTVGPFLRKRPMNMKFRCILRTPENPNPASPTFSIDSRFRTLSSLCHDFLCRNCLLSSTSVYRLVYTLSSLGCLHGHLKLVLSAELFILASLQSHPQHSYSHSQKMTRLSANLL